MRKKEAEVASTGNPLIRKRFEDALKKFRADLEVKMHEMTSARSRSLTQEAIRIERSKKSRAQWTLESAVCFGSISTSLTRVGQHTFTSVNTTRSILLRTRRA